MFSFKIPRRPAAYVDVSSHEKPLPNAPLSATMKNPHRDAALGRLADMPSTLTHSQPLSIPSRASSRASSASSRHSRDAMKGREKSSSKHKRAPRDSVGHNSDAVPASVAALLAMTAIPPRKNGKKRLDGRSRRISIEQLVQEWRAEALGMPSNASHKSMEMLLEPCEVACADSLGSSFGGFPVSRTSSRSISSESIPSLDPDDRSLFSLGNPPTPDAVRLLSSPGSSSLRRTKQRSLTTCTEDCASDHPLIAQSVSDVAAVDSDDNTSISSFMVKPTKSADRRKSGLKSNLTASLQSLKSRALSSLSQFSLSNVGPNPSYNPYAFSDATLWEHPFIFPRVGPEIRPDAFTGTPTKSQRRYFNPIALSFDEQQTYFRQALHTSQSEVDRSMPMIQMQTYSRPRRSMGRSKSSPASSSSSDNDANSRSSPGSPPSSHIRPREPRENSDFLRVVVLEMNMRRVGKLEETVAGRAKIWLPPRQTATSPGDRRDDADTLISPGGSVLTRSQTARVTPRRWQSVSADD